MILVLFVFVVTMSLGDYTPNLKLYKSTQEIYNWFQQKQSEYPEIIKTHKCSQDQDIRYYTFGNSSRDIKVMINCGIHARQLITSDTCVSIFNQILKNKDQYEDMFLLMLPVANKNRQKVLAGKTCIRVNQNEVDPNRNFPIDWENGDKNKGSETYQGPSPLSQKSSRCIDGILSDNHYNLFLDLHTGQFSVFYAENIHNSEFNKSTLAIANQIKKDFCPHCLKSTILKHHGTMAGSLFQYASKVKKVDHSYVLQIFGGKFSYEMMGDYKACMKQFNPNSEKARNYYIHTWTKIAQRMIDRVIEIMRNKRNQKDKRNEQFQVSIKF